MSNESNKLIPEAANRQPFLLTVAAPVHKATAVKQVAEPGIVGIALRRTPPATVETNGVEWSIVETETARKTGKTTTIGAIAVSFPATGAFHFGGC